MTDQSGPRPPEIRDRNLSSIIARIRDDGPALVDVDEAPDPRSRGPVAPGGPEILRAAPLVWEPPRAASPGSQLGSRSSTPAAPTSQVPPAKPAGDGPASPAASAGQLGWLLPGALVAASLVALGVVGLLYLAPPQAPVSGTANAGEPALRSQLAALQGTIATLSERIESLTTEAESRPVEALGERLDRMSRQVAELARDDRLPGDLDRRLEALALGLDTMVQRVERLSDSNESPQGIEMAEGAAVGGASSTLATLAGVRDQGHPAIGVADLGLDPVPRVPEVSGQGLDPRGTTEGRPAEVADAVSPPAPFLAQARPLGEHDLSVGPQEGDSGSNGGGPAAEASDPESAPPETSLPADALRPERLLSQDETDVLPPSEEAPIRADLAEESPRPTVNQVQSPWLAASSEQVAPGPVEAVASVGDSAAQPKLRPSDASSRIQGVKLVRQRVATASKSQSKGQLKGPQGEEDEPVRRPPLRVVDDLF